MAASDYHLLFVDLDGTLVGKTDTLPPRTLRALREAGRRGCTPVICTGRSRYTTRRVADQLDGHRYVIVLNGAAIYDWQAGEPIFRTGLSMPVALRTIGLMRELGIAPLCSGVQEDDRWIYTERALPPPDDYLRRNQERLVCVDRLEDHLERPPVCVVAYGAMAKIRALADRLRGEFNDAINVIESAATQRYTSWVVEIHPPDAGKATAARTVAEALGVPREQTLAIGDHLNDTDLLRWAGFGVAMGDGVAEARASADHVTGTLAEEGAAMAIERFVLGR